MSGPCPLPCGRWMGAGGRLHRWSGHRCNYRANHEAHACVQVRRDLPGMSRGRAHPLPCRYVGTVAMPARSAGEGRTAAPRRARHRMPQRQDIAHQGGRAPGRGEHWHRTCMLSVQHPGSTAGGDAVVPDGCRRDLLPQARAMFARPAKSCRSQPRVGQMASREAASMYQATRPRVSSRWLQCCRTWRSWADSCGCSPTVPGPFPWTRPSRRGG